MLLIDSGHLIFYLFFTTYLLIFYYYFSLLFQDIKKKTVNISLHQPLSNVLLCSRPVLIAGLTSIFWYNPHLTHQSHSGLSTNPGSDYSLPTKNSYTVYVVVHRYLFPLCATLWRLQPSTHQEGLPSHTIKSTIIWYAHGQSSQTGSP